MRPTIRLRGLRLPPLSIVLAALALGVGAFGFSATFGTPRYAHPVTALPELPLPDIHTLSGALAQAEPPHKIDVPMLVSSAPLDAATAEPSAVVEAVAHGASEGGLTAVSTDTTPAPPTPTATPSPEPTATPTKTPDPTPAGAIIQPPKVDPRAIVYGNRHPGHDDTPTATPTPSPMPAPTQNSKGDGGTSGGQRLRGMMFWR